MSAPLLATQETEAAWGSEAVARRPFADVSRTVISRNNLLLTVSAAAVGALSYACTLLMANSLSSAQFSDFAAAQMLLGITGTIASALVPLPLSHAVTANPAGSSARREGMSFAVLVSFALGASAALISGFVTAAFATVSLGAAVALAALMLFLLAAPQGWLQGELRFRWLALVSFGEIAARFGFSVLVVVLSWGAVGGVLGFVVGALALALVPMSFYRDLSFRPVVLRQRWRWAETGDIALVLCVVSVLVGLDVVAVAFLDGSSDLAAGFQALATIAKGPVYVAAATALVAFPLLRKANTDKAVVGSHSLRSFGWLALPAAAVIATAPHELMKLLLPSRYDAALILLPWLALSGLGYATLSVLATLLLALRLYRRCQLGLVVASGLIVIGLSFGWSAGGIIGLAAGTAIGSALAAAVLVWIAWPSISAVTARSFLPAVAVSAVLAGILGLLSATPWLWLAVTGVCGALVLKLQRGDTGEGLTPFRRQVGAQPIWISQGVGLGLAGFVTTTILALGIRAVGLTRSFELQGDELLYSELARSVSRGQTPTLQMDNLPDGPFFLHPPGFFLLAGAVIRMLGLTGSTFDLVYDLRWINALLGAVTVGVGFLLMRRLANVQIAWISAIVLAFEPFLLRNHSRVYLETLGSVAVLAGFLVVVSVLTWRSVRPTRLPLFLGGLLLGYGVLTKDVFALWAVAPVLLAVVWRRTLAVHQAIPVLVGSVVPYMSYLLVLRVEDLLPGWVWAKSYGARRMLGFEQETGFNAEGAPSLISRMIDQAASFGTSYVLLGLGPLAALLVCFSPRSERRLVGLAGLAMGLFGLYSAAFGTFEEQYGYPVMVAGIFSIAIGAKELLERRRFWRRPLVYAGVLFTALVVVLGTRAVTTTDNGFSRFREWKDTHLPAASAVGVTNITAELAFAELSDDDTPRFGAWPSPALLEENGADYILTQSDPTMEGYGYARPELLQWLEGTATEVVSFEGPTNGSTTLWRLDPAAVRKAAEAGVSTPTENYYAER